jgi:hypothetical protein
MRATIIRLLFALTAASCSPENETSDPDICAIKSIHPVPYNPQLENVVDLSRGYSSAETRRHSRRCLSHSTGNWLSRSSRSSEIGWRPSIMASMIVGDSSVS